MKLILLLAMLTVTSCGVQVYEDMNGLFTCQVDGFLSIERYKYSKLEDATKKCEREQRKRK